MLSVELMLIGILIITLYIACCHQMIKTEKGIKKGLRGAGKKYIASLAFVVSMACLFLILPESAEAERFFVVILFFIALPIQCLEFMAIASNSGHFYFKIIK